MAERAGDLSGAFGQGFCAGAVGAEVVGAADVDALVEGESALVVWAFDHVAWAD